MFSKLNLSFLFPEMLNGLLSGTKGRKTEIVIMCRLIFPIEPFYFLFIGLVNTVAEKKGFHL